MTNVEELRAAVAYQPLRQAVRRADPATVFDALSTELADDARLRLVLSVLAQPSWVAKPADPRRAARENLRPPEQPLDPRWLQVVWPLTSREDVRDAAIELVRYLLLDDGPARSSTVEAVARWIVDVPTIARYSRLYVELVRTRDAAAVAAVARALEDADPLARVRAASALLYEEGTAAREPLVDRLLAAVTASDDFRVLEAAISAIEAFASPANAPALVAAVAAWQARCAGMKKSRDEIPQPLLAFELLSGVAKHLGIAIAKPATRTKRRRGLPG